MGRDARQRIEQISGPFLSRILTVLMVILTLLKVGNKPLELTQSWPKCLVAISFLNAVLAFTVVYTHSVLLFGQD